MKKIIVIENITESQAKEILQLATLSSVSVKNLVYTKMEICEVFREPQKALYVGTDCYKDNEFHFCLVIEETGKVYFANFRYNGTAPVNTFPIIDYLRKQKLTIE